MWQHEFVYHISLVISQEFFLPKQSQNSRTILQDRSRSFGLYRKDKICIIAKLHWTGLVICSHSREGKARSYSRINMVYKNSVESGVSPACPFHKIEVNL